MKDFLQGLYRSAAPILCCSQILLPLTLQAENSKPGNLMEVISEALQQLTTKHVHFSYSSSEDSIQPVTFNVAATFVLNTLKPTSTVVLQITPFATDRKGHIHTAAPSTLNIPGDLVGPGPYLIPLNVVNVNHSLNGNYTVGYFVDEISGSFNEPGNQGFELTGLGIGNAAAQFGLTSFPLSPVPYNGFNGFRVFASTNMEVFLQE